jgi:hypothetical protein
MAHAGGRFGLKTPGHRELVLRELVLRELVLRELVWIPRSMNGLIPRSLAG